MTEADSSGKIAGTECSDVIVGDEETTYIEGGDGDDVIIGDTNLVAADGGDGWDYIVGNSAAAVLLGGSGNDIIEGGDPLAPEKLASSAQDQVELAASVLPSDEASEFLELVDEQLRIAYETESRGETKIDVSLREEAIEANQLVQDVMGSPDKSITDPAERQKAKDLQAEAEAYLKKTSAFPSNLQKKLGGQAGTASQMSRQWGTDPIWGLDNNNDILFGGRGSDEIYGRSGDDLLYGGIEDDSLFGQDGDDYMLGGFGSDKINGGNGNDIAQGDATGDKMWDTGGSTGDVLSYASGGTNGFPTINMTTDYPNFPPSYSAERGVYVNLGTAEANNGTVVAGGGGNDPASATPGEGTNFSQFEHVVGTPFADKIVGNGAVNVLQGGGGSDVIIGAGSAADVLIGDAGGDNLSGPAGTWLIGGPGEDYCGGSTVIDSTCDAKPSNWVGPRNFTKISVGMTSQGFVGNQKTQIYMAGSTTDWLTRGGQDEVNVTLYEDGVGPPSYYFTTPASTFDGQFSTLPEDSTPGCSYTETQVLCSPSTNAVTLVLAGFGSNDDIEVFDVKKMTNPIILGGDGFDLLRGGNLTDDFMHDGIDGDTMLGYGGDDGLINSFGQDTLWGNVGDDLVESNSVCEGDAIDGGSDTDSTSWVQYRTDVSAGGAQGVFASLGTGVIGRNYQGAATCSSEGPANTMNAFEDLEGTRHWDVLRGDESSNQLIGRASNDQLRSNAAEDRILAMSADNDNVDCGNANSDIAVVDKPQHGSDSTVNCETVNQSDPWFVGS